MLVDASCGNDIGASNLHSFQLEMKKHLGIFGPSLEDLKRFEVYKEDSLNQLETAKAVRTITKNNRAFFKKGGLGSLRVDEADALEVCNGMVDHGMGKLHHNIHVIEQLTVTKAQKKQLKNILNEVINILRDVSYELLELRHEILHAQGKAPAFRACKENFASILKATKDNAVKDDQGFVEV